MARFRDEGGIEALKTVRQALGRLYSHYDFCCRNLLSRGTGVPYSMATELQFLNLLDAKIGNFADCDNSSV